MKFEDVFNQYMGWNASRRFAPARLPQAFLAETVIIGQLT
jgi:hypothetical protein